MIQLQGAIKFNGGGEHLCGRAGGGEERMLVHVQAPMLMHSACPLPSPQVTSTTTSSGPTSVHPRWGHLGWGHVGQRGGQSEPWTTGGRVVPLASDIQMSGLPHWEASVTIVLGGSTPMPCASILYGTIRSLHTHLSSHPRPCYPCYLTLCRSMLVDCMALAHLAV